ncbi:MAG: hypothetical protein IJ300_06160, partial [Clostridia bacterium]|nr:hypothetical protein [Clostridia bacterium]
PTETSGIKMNTCKSTSFIMNNRLYLIDGKNYIYFDGNKVVDVAEDNPYTPTTYINITPDCDMRKQEYEQRNIFQPKFRCTFTAYLAKIDDKGTENAEDDETLVEAVTEFLMPENVTELVKVELDDKELIGETDYTFENNKISLTDKAKNKITKSSTITVTASRVTSMFYKDGKAVDGIDVIKKCTIACVFDNRVFLSGNPEYPNHIFWCMLNSTGHPDPSYFGIMNYQQDGVGNSPITGMIPIADALMVLKNDTQQDGSVYYHTPQLTGEDLYAKTYPSKPGLNGIGCLGACVNFLDDPVFVSRLGLEAVGQLSVRYERAIEHRSSLIDAKLVVLGEEELKNAVLEEWNGYLLLLVDGKIFMADSRQRYTHEIGVMQYEWYYLEDIGVYDGSWDEYVYDSYLPDVLKNVNPLDGYEFALHENVGESVNYKANVDIQTYTYTYTEKDENSESGETTYSYDFSYVRDEATQKAYLCSKSGVKVGGDFKKATTLKSINGNIFFGTEDGTICSFNFDKRDTYGSIAPRYYTFDGRIIFCGAATKMDCCGIPHLTKNTVKKSTVIKTKAMVSSSVKIMVRTNDKPYQQIARINTNKLDFNDINFNDFTFITQDETIFTIKEKEKKWVEKQYYVFSDELCKPFSLYYISYRYNVAGRIKI